jgi:hypothetical protein
VSIYTSTGKLNDSAVNRFAIAQQIAKLPVALAQASEAPVKFDRASAIDSSDLDHSQQSIWATLGDYVFDRQ